MQPLRCVLLAAVLVPSLLCQDPVTNGDKEINARVQRLRENIVEGRQIRSHVRVAVRLKNGNRIKGVVKDGRLVERVEGLRFVQAEANQQGAGIRVWYFDNSKNYVFLPFVDIADYKVQARLSSEQVIAIEQQLADDVRKKQELDQLKAPPEPGSGDGTTAEPTKEGAQPPPSGDGQQPPAPAGEGEARPADSKPPADGKLTEEQTRLFALLQQYPPQAGWNEAKRDEIKYRFAAIHIMPSASELHFVEVFDDWQKAVTTFGVKVESSGESGGDGGRSGSNSGSTGSTEGSGRTRGRRK